MSEGSPLRRLSSLLLAFATAPLAIALGCRGLGPLPAPQRVVPRDPPTSTKDFWEALATGNPLPAVSESAFRSTVRMVLGDGLAKQKDQKAARACKSAPPPGFEALEGIAVDSPVAGAIAPLHAYFRRGEAGKPIVFVIHGLYDSRNTLYVRRAAELLAGQGFGVLVPDMRWHGCLLSQQWLPGLGFEESQDLLAWGRWLSAREPGRELALLGFSLGALDVIHTVAAADAPQVFRGGGIALSPPAELARTMGALDRGTRFTDRGLLRILDKGFRQLLVVRMKDQGIAPRPGHEHEPFGAVLDHVIAQRFAMLGLTRAGLFAATDPSSKIQAARRPLLLLTTTNDPFFGEVAAAALTRAAAGNPWVKVIETPYGGHIGQPGLYPQWISNLATRFFTGSAGVDHTD